MENSLFNISIAFLLAVIIAVAVIVSVLFGCVKEERSDTPNINDGRANINISFFLPQKAWTKLLNVSPIQVSNVNIYVCVENGDVVRCQYLSKTFSMTLPVQKGAKYFIYALANTGKPIVLKDTAAIENYTWGVSAASELADASGGVVMSGKTGLIALSDGVSVPITLTRSIAKITLRGDKSSLNAGVKIDINSATIKNIPKNIRLFKINNAVDGAGVMNGDVISGADLKDFFTTGVTFYMFENMQGTLMPANTDQTKKLWPDNNIFSKICSYIELNATYLSPQHKGTLVYRFYLGKDMTGNFDVERNSQHTITVFFAGDGSLYENTWRVDIEYITDLVTGIVLQPGMGIAGLGNVRKIECLIIPNSATDKTLLWNSSDISVATVDQNGFVTSAGFGYCNITACSCDGGNVKGTCRVEVAPGDISFPPGPRVMFDGESAEIAWSKIYPPGSIPNVTCSNTSVVKINNVSSDKLSVTALKPGTATLTAILGNSSSSYVINVEDLKINFVQSAPVAVNVGFDTKISYTITPSHASNLKLKWSYANEAGDKSYFCFVNGDASSVVRGIKASDQSNSAHVINVSFVDYPSEVFATSLKVVPAITINDDDINLLANAFVSEATGATYSDISRERLISYNAHPNAKITWTTSAPDLLKISASGRVYTEESTLANGSYAICAETRGDDGTTHKCYIRCVVWEEINVLGISEYTQEGEENGIPYFTLEKMADVRSIREGGYVKSIGTGCVTTPDFPAETIYHLEGAAGDPYHSIGYTTLYFATPFDASSIIDGYRYRYYISNSSWIP